MNSMFDKVLTIAILPVLLFAACASTGPDDRGIVHKSYALKNSAANHVAQVLTAEVGATPGHRIVIVADPKLNAVVVRGTPADHVQLEKRIRELDVR